MSELGADSDDDELLDSADNDLLDVEAATPSPAIQRRQQAAAEDAESLLQDRRVQAFLGALRQGESGNPDGRYNKIVNGGTPAGRFINGGTFDDYSRHPNVSVPQPNGKSSTAAGAYQFITGTWNESAQRLGLPDFMPHSQDLAAVDQLQHSGAIKNLLEGHDLERAAYSAAKIWDSLPTGSSGLSSSERPRPKALQTFKDR